MFVLHNPVREYAWGSTWHIPRMCGLPETDRPAAEMWFGAHPADPSRLDDGRTLDEAIAASPEEMLGADVNRAFGGRLPFLMKLLAANEPLSLQVHPTSERARIRFAEQNAAGIPLTAPERSYQDASHKPELIYALTRFEGMAGFRDPAKTAAILQGLELPWLDEIADRIERTVTPFQTSRQVVTELLATDETVVTGRLRELREAALIAEKRAHAERLRLRIREADPSALVRESLRVYGATARLVEQYPHDPGVLVTLLLNHVVLAAGEAMFIDAGVIHAYTSGFGVEIMAASDNVLRAGLTPKYVDIKELLEITNFTPIPPPLWASQPLEGGERLDPPVEEFEFRVLRLGDGPLTLDPAPQILLCLQGVAVLRTDVDEQKAGRGQSVFVPGGEGAVSLRGDARVAVGRAPV